MEEPETKLNLFEYVSVAFRYKALVVLCCLGAVAAAYLYTRRQPILYESMASAIVGQLGRPAGPRDSIALTGGPTPGVTSATMFVTLMKTRRMTEEAIQHFGLQRLGAPTTADATAMLAGMGDFSFTSEGALVVKFRSTDPELAADLANYYLEGADRLTLQLGFSEAKRQRVFLEKRLPEARTTLRQAEEKLRAFQETNKSILFGEAASRTMTEAASIRTAVRGAELGLEILRSRLTDKHREVIQQKKQLEELKKQLAQVEFESSMLLPPSQNPGTPRESITFPFSRVPELALELTRLDAEVKLHQTLFNMLQEQMVQVRIQEAKEGPTFQILDRAVPRQRTLAPPMQRNLIFGGGFGLFAGVGLALLINAIRTGGAGVAAAPAAVPGEAEGER
ncbi:MAG: hypothetical protein HY535_00220 [Chloroflexi bacterium]|nr:hypothetical protein [Chloroflexota bacterium]